MKNNKYSQKMPRNAEELRSLITPTEEYAKQEISDFHKRQSRADNLETARSILRWNGRNMQGFHCGGRHFHLSMIKWFLENPLRGARVYLNNFLSEHGADIPASEQRIYLESLESLENILPQIFAAQETADDLRHTALQLEITTYADFYPINIQRRRNKNKLPKSLDELIIAIDAEISQWGQKGILADYYIEKWKESFPQRKIEYLSEVFEVLTDIAVEFIENPVLSTDYTHIETKLYHEFPKVDMYYKFSLDGVGQNKAILERRIFKESFHLFEISLCEMYAAMKATEKYKQALEAVRDVADTALSLSKYSSFNLSRRFRWHTFTHANGDVSARCKFRRE